MTDEQIIHIAISPVSGYPDHFEARLDGELLVASTRQPLLDGARQLLERGYAASAIVVMKDAKSGMERLRSVVGVAAALTVKEKDRGSGPRFARWQPYAPPSPVPEPIAPNASSTCGGRGFA
jgi:hypothetical protein